MKLRNLFAKLGQRCTKLATFLRKAQALAVLLLAFVASFSSAFASDLNWNFTFSPSDIVLSSCGEYTVVSLADGANTRDAIGSPAIPAKFVNILLPDGAADVTVTATGSLELLASDITPWPVQRVAPKSKVQPPFTAPDSAAYFSPNPWPLACATYEGIHEMQGSTFVSVRLNPIVYVGSEKALYYRPSISVNVSYSAPSAPRSTKALHGSRVSSMVNALVVNPAASSVAPRGSRRVEGLVDYLIITSSSLSSAFQNLADYRASALGGDYSTLVITKESISSDYSGDDIQMKIRNCIKDYVSNHGTTYVVLGGDDTIVPDRDTYAKVDETVESHMPTDLYYSDLTGTWKASGSSKYGTLNANVDMSPDVIVGRIPIRNATQLNGYLAKVRAFEADLSHTRNSIILGGPAAWCRYYGNKRPSDDVTGDGHSGFRTNHDYVSDSEMWLRRLYRDGIKSYWDNAESATDRTINLACDAITSWDTSKCGDKELSANNLKTWLNKGYTHLMFSGHGFPQGWGMESYTNYSTTQASSQTGIVAFVYTDACLTGAFDQDGISSAGTITLDVGTQDQYTYTSEPCLGEAFIRNSKGGSLVHMGCARYGWGEPDYLDSDPDNTDSDGYYTKCTASNTSNGGPSTIYAYKFYKRLYEVDAVRKNRTLGEAFAMSKADMISQCGTYDCNRWIQFGLNFLGDPAIALYPRSALVAPKDLAISDVTTTSFSAAWTAVDGANSYQVDVIKGTSFETGEYVTGWQSTTVDGTSANITDLMPNTTYSVRVCAVNSEYISNWSDIVTATTAAAESAPVWSAFPEETYNIYVSDEFELSIGEYVYALPTPTLSMISSDSEEAIFDSSKGKFLFTPSVVGIYHFTFRAENTHGIADVTLTVNVAIPPVTVPTMAVNEADVTSSTAPVSWTVCDDVVGYTLQLATDNAFSTGSQGTSVTLVENSAANSTAPEGWTYNISSSSASYLILLKDHYVITEVFDASACTALELSLYMRTYGGTTDESNILVCEYSTDKNNWTGLGTISAANNILSKKTLDASAAAGAGPVYFRFSAPGATSSKGVGIKSIKITGTEMVGGSLVSTTFVNDPAYTFTELEPGTTYYARVKGEADWSNIISFTTNHVLILASEADNNDAISTAATNGGRCDVTLQGCTFKKDGDWNTICLPFNQTIAGSTFNGADVRALDNASFEDGTLILNFTAEKAVKTIMAGTPYIIKWPYGSKIMNPVFENVVIDNTKNDFISSDGNVRFVGTYNLVSFEAENRSILFMRADNALCYPTKRDRIEAFSSYVLLPEGSQVSQFVLNIDNVDDPTGIASPESSPEGNQWPTIYNLAGQQIVNGKPSYRKLLRGIYIQNGKKVVK